MKRLKLNPVIKTKITTKNIVLSVVCIVIAVSFPLQLTSNVKADDYDKRIEKIENEIKQYQSEAKKLSKKADSLQKEIAALNAQKKVIQKRIDIQQVERNKLVAQIAETENNIEHNRKLLGNTISEIYLSSDVSPLEMLASSKSIADFVDKQTYRNSMQNSLVLTISNIKRMKIELEQKKQDVDRVIAEQKLARNALIAKEQDRANLVAETRGEEAAYRQLVGQRESQKLKLQQEQQKAIEAALRATGGPINVLPGDPNKGGYPWEQGCWVDSEVWSHGGQYGDGHDPLGYACRQCTSYAAWKVGQRTQKFPMYWGNANMWPDSARALGYETGSEPRVNSAGVISAGEYGHVVWVEAVNGDGTIDISQYNYYNAGGSGWGNYSEMRVSAATYDTYIYF